MTQDDHGPVRLEKIDGEWVTIFAIGRRTSTEAEIRLWAELAKLRALLSSARLAMQICIPKPSCHSIGVIAQIDEAIGEAGVHCSAWRGEGTK